MAVALAISQPLRPDQPVGLWRGIGLAVLAHGLLLLMLKAGLDWRSHAEPALEAEIWAAVPQAAAPRAEEPPQPPPQPARPRRRR